MARSACVEAAPAPKPTDGPIAPSFRLEVTSVSVPKARSSEAYDCHSACRQSAAPQPPQASLCGDVPSPIQQDAQIAAQIDTSEFAHWPDAPVALVINQGITQGAGGPSGQWVRANPTPSRAAEESVEVETDLFKGKVAVWLKGLPSTPSGLFDGKKRASWVAVQGRFKREVAVEDVWTGQELARPLKALPARWFVENVLVRIARSISSSVQVGPLSAPSVLSPLLALAQVVNVSLPGQEPDIFSPPEDCTLLTPDLKDRSGAPLGAEARRAHYSKAANRKGLVYSPDHVWTFHIWQQFIDLSTYKLDLGMGYCYNLVSHLAGQPLQIMIKHSPAGQPASYLFNFQVWNKALAGDVMKHTVASNAQGAKTVAAAASSGGRATRTAPQFEAAAPAAPASSDRSEDASWASDQEVLA